MSFRLTAVILDLPLIRFDITFSQLIHMGRTDMQFSAVRDKISYIVDIVKNYPSLSDMTIQEYIDNDIPMGI